MKLSSLEKMIDRRKAVLGFAGDDYVLPNSGQSRDQEKQQLLAMIAAKAAERGISLTFKANY